MPFLLISPKIVPKIQLIKKGGCFEYHAVIADFLLRNVMGNSNAATVMVLLMLPAFLFAMYEKDGMHLEDVLMHMIRVKFLRSPVRKYETENYYETDPEQIRQSPDTGKPKGGKTVAKKEK